MKVSFAAFCFLSLTTIHETAAVKCFDYSTSIRNFILDDTYYEWLKTTRRDLHRRPELSLYEKETSDYIKKTLDSLGVSYTSGWGKVPASLGASNDTARGAGYGVVAELGTGKSPCVLLRGDMDALPILEMTDVPFKSENDGVMHACGHDAHTTILLGAAKILKNLEHEIPGTVRLMFQPAEEVAMGALPMIQEGLLTKSPPVEMAFGLHVDPAQPLGDVAATPGFNQAGIVHYEVTFKGKGGHGAQPHVSIDPISPLVMTVQKFDQMMSREVARVPAEEAAVLSTTVVQAGIAQNVIASESKLTGTLRALKVEVLEHLHGRMLEIVHGIALANNCQYVFKVLNSVPGVFNDARASQLMTEAADGIFKGQEGKGLTHLKNVDRYPSFGAEDMAYVNMYVPSCFPMTGFVVDPKIPQAMLHHPEFKLNEDILRHGSALYAGWAFTALEDLRTKAGVEKCFHHDHGDTKRGGKEVQYKSSLEQELTTRRIEADGIVERLLGLQGVWEGPEKPVFKKVVSPPRTTPQEQSSTQASTTTIEL